MKHHILKTALIICLTLIGPAIPKEANAESTNLPFNPILNNNSTQILTNKDVNLALADKVGNVLEDLLSCNFHIASGGAIGADQFVIERLLRIDVYFPRKREQKK